MSVVGPGHELGLLNCLLDRGPDRNTVGENSRYLWVVQRRARRLDQRSARQRNLGLLTNNTRFLVLPWVTNLASHLLGLIARRIGADWQAKYGHPVHALETFVEHRFRGTCYRAANWVRLGETRGRQRPRESYPGCG